MSEDQVTRREFVRDGAAAAAGLAIGLSATGATAAEKQPATNPAQTSRSKIINYNEKMEYRPLGDTGLMVSAICMGGHWKQLQPKFGSDEFKKNRHDVVSACIDHGINYIDACVGREVKAYSEALRGRREKMYLGYSWYEHEARFEEWQTAKKLLEGFEAGLREIKQDYVDLWRITCFEAGSNHTPAHEEAIAEALEKAKKSGKARFTGVSSHHRNWLLRMIESHPDQMDVVVTPYTASSKKKPKDSLFDVAKKYKVGIFGIKPFGSGSIFRSRGVINPATQKVDDDRARLALRYILCNDALTAPIPGLISVDQVKNAASAVTERRQFDLAETRRYQRAVEEMWANLPEDYQWLRDFEWV